MNRQCQFYCGNKVGEGYLPIVEQYGLITCGCKPNLAKVANAILSPSYAPSDIKKVVMIVAQLELRVAELQRKLEIANNPPTFEHSTEDHFLRRSQL